MERTVLLRNFGLMYQFAQRVRTQVGADAWIVPGEGYICVMRAPGGVAGCNTTAETINQGMSLVALDSAPHDRNDRKRYLLLGIAPDGVRKVTVRTEGGIEVTVPVIDNTYAYRAGRMMHATLVRDR